MERPLAPLKALARRLAPPSPPFSAPAPCRVGAPTPLATLTTSSPHRPRRLPGALLLLLALLACLGTATPAHADDDPASAALSSQDVYVPVGQPLRGTVISELHDLTVAARRAHHPVKVAVIASPADLDVLGRLVGGPSTYFGSASAYARFLSRELSYVFSGDVLVAMPNGLGMFDATAAGNAHETLAGIRVDRQAGASGVAEAATIALRRLVARANGASAASPSGGAGLITPARAGALAGALAAGLAVLLMLRVRRRRRAIGAPLRLSLRSQRGPMNTHPRLPRW